MSEQYNVQLNLFKDRSEETPFLNETIEEALEDRSGKARKIREQAKERTYSESEAGRIGFPINGDGTLDRAKVVTNGLRYVSNIKTLGGKKAVAERLKSSSNYIEQAQGQEISKNLKPIEEAGDKERLTDMNTDTEYGRPRR